MSMSKYVRSCKEKHRREKKQREEKKASEYAKLCFSNEELAEIPDYLNKHISRMRANYGKETIYGREPSGYLLEFRMSPSDTKIDSIFLGEEKYYLEVEEFPTECQERARQDLDFGKTIDAFNRLKDTSSISEPEDIEVVLSKFQQFKENYVTGRIKIQRAIISDWLSSQIGKDAKATVKSFFRRIEHQEDCSGAFYSIHYNECCDDIGTYSKQDFLYNLPTIYEYYAMIACQTRFEMTHRYSTW